jgi:hypothetical protein
MVQGWAMVDRDEPRTPEEIIDLCRLIAADCEKQGQPVKSVIPVFWRELSGA